MRKIALVLVGLSSVMVACPGSSSESGGETSTGDGDGDGDGDTGDGDTGDGDGDGDGDTGDGDGDTGDGDGDGDPVNPCADFTAVDADKTVTLSVTNQGNAPRYIVTSADQCPVYGLERRVEDAYETVNNHSWFTCPCECPGIPEPQPETLRLVEPAATIELAWDGRRVHTCQGLADCSDWGEGFVPDTFFAQRPAEPGEYRVTLAYFDTLPEDCEDSGEGIYSCFFNNDPPNGAAACGAEASASAELVLAQGDVEAQLLLP